MSFGKLRRALGQKASDNSYELLRFCSAGNIPGIASKMFKYFTRKYKPAKIMSYCDLRWGTGDLYEKLGFKFAGKSAPNYWYTKDYTIREHRYSYRKSVLIDDGYDSTKSEWEIMFDRGYDRIWDCGNYKYIWKAVI